MISELQQQKEKCIQLVKYKEMAERLMRNKDFKELVLKYWCVEECARYVQASGDTNLPKDNREQALAMAQAAGHFKRFLEVVNRMGEHAKGQIEEIDAAIAAEEE